MFMNTVISDSSALAGYDSSSSVKSSKSGLSAKNSMMEGMRSRIKDSLFQKKSISLQAIHSKDNLEDETAENSAQKPGDSQGITSLNQQNSKHQKSKSLAKGLPSDLTQSPFSPGGWLSNTILSSPSKNSFIDETIEIQECQDSGQPSQSEKTTENDQVRRYSFEEVEECTLEEGLKISFKRVNHGLELAEKVEEKRVKQPIFYNTMEDDIEELKKDLNIEHDPTIHFIKGTFKGHYEEGDILGEGTTGTVKKCTKIGTNDSFAVKIVNYKGDTEMLVLIVNEFKNCRKLDHHHIIKVHELYVDYLFKKIYSVMELSECREMYEVLHDLGHYSEAVASGIFKQILTGINYLHTNGICHRDLKPNNILVSEDGKNVKITDFNVSKFTDNNKKYSSLSTDNCKMWTHTGTIAFTAPEVFTENEYTEAVDMWSAGVVLYTILCGYQPFDSEYVQDLITIIKEGKFEFKSDPWDKISDLAKDLIRKCLDTNYKTRYLPSDALMHPWIAHHGKASDILINLPLDNLRLYVSKGRQQNRRRCSTKTENKNLQFVSGIRNRNRRSGTTVEPSEIEIYNHKKEEEDKTEDTETDSTSLIKALKDFKNSKFKGLNAKFLPECPVQPSGMLKSSFKFQENVCVETTIEQEESSPDSRQNRKTLDKSRIMTLNGVLKKFSFKEDEIKDENQNELKKGDNSKSDDSEEDSELNSEEETV